jgi:hypothetical protein
MVSFAGFPAPAEMEEAMEQNKRINIAASDLFILLSSVV